MGQLAIDLKTTSVRHWGEAWVVIRVWVKAATGLVKEDRVVPANGLVQTGGGASVGCPKLRGCSVKGRLPFATPRSAAPTPPSTPSPPSSPSHKAQGSRRRCRGLVRVPESVPGNLTVLVSWRLSGHSLTVGQGLGLAPAMRGRCSLWGALKVSALEVLNQLPAGEADLHSSVLRC
ncbi:hypothetical protein GWK47_020442 [Chionoecetes opilio]|uniref:Uncharacterized protein n=1 Tax=Chionoecetes opilio TaxID=41210 RepID=A0A8J5CKV5_CHIOP|nr:hypothetical protein GWK47_020442 [Chionoecetes opilio]